MASTMAMVDSEASVVTDMVTLMVLTLVTIAVIGIIIEATIQQIITFQPVLKWQGLQPEIKGITMVTEAITVDMVVVVTM